LGYYNKRNGSGILLLPNLKEERSRNKIDYQRLEFELDSSFCDVFKGKTYFLKTYGCQMNEHDSENIKAMLEELGFLEVEDYEKADLVLLNTCSIRENANNKAFGMLGRLKHLKEENKGLIVGICGCMAQEEKVIQDILDKYQWINFVVGTNNLYQLPEVIAKVIESKQQQIEVYSREQDLVEQLPVKRDNPYSAYVNIIYGCDKFCTYCIVPYTRGRQRSRTMEDILNEVDHLIHEGYQEVILLGQNVNAYGKDLAYGYDLADLLEKIALTKIPRIRFVTSHPWDFTDKMIDVISKYNNICPSIHLPVQSGSNQVLKRMGRRYTIEQYLTLFDKLKAKKKNCAISTDIIVGFPNETEEDFMDTLKLVEYCKFDNAFTFIFSKREGTPAAKMKDNVSDEIKEKRLQQLNEVVNQYFLENNQALLGTTVDVLVMGTSEKKDGYLYGYTDTMKLINFIGEKSMIGKIVRVEVIDAKTWSLDGRAL